MDKILIWDDSPQRAEKLKNRLEKLSQFTVESASTAQAVRDILDKKPISVVVINFVNNHLEKLQLIGYMTRHKWKTPCIVIIKCDFADTLRKMNQQILHLVPQPLQFKELVSSIVRALYLRDEGQSHSGMSLINFLLLLELTRQTCRLEIRAPAGRRGFFYFRDGELLDAQYQLLHGDEAFSELLAWTKVMVYFRDLPERRTRKLFTQNLMEIIQSRLIENTAELI